MGIRRYSVHQVLYYDNVCGVPQIGHFVTNEANEAEQAFYANEHTQDLLDIADRTVHVMTFTGFADFMGRIPRILAN